MTFKQTDSDSIRSNWADVRNQVKRQFTEVTDDDLNQVGNDPDRLAEKIAQRTGRDRPEVEQQLAQMAQS